MKNFILLLTFCILISSPIKASANNSITTNNPADIYVKAITLESTFHSGITPLADMVTITKEFKYDSIITPKSSLPWTETISGIPFSGTLYLQSFYYSGGKTVATYKGTLSAQ